MKVILSGLVIIVLGFAAYVRLAPADPRLYHKLPEPDGPEDEELDGGYIRRLHLAPESGAAVLTRLDQIIRATPRTKVLAGSVAAGMITYETRSALWGFPDYTTVALTGQTHARLVIRGHLRFGKSDMGVNKARITGWIAQLEAGQ